MSRHLHFMGAGGVGMCGLAEVMIAEGYKVSGCDLEGSERTERLMLLGAEIREGHDPSHLSGVDALIVTSAVDPEHPEVAAAMDGGLPVVRRAELLAELMKGRRGVAVSGTHGKTTTTALLGHLLSSVDLDPTVVVGGRVRFLGSHGRRGLGDILVCEADEYDRSFLELSPVLAVVTNLEAEHLDCYGGEDELRAAFVDFTNRVSPFGAVILNVDDAGSRMLQPRLRRRVISYGTASDAELRATEVEGDEGGSSFAMMSGDRRLGAVRIPLTGRHNVANALAAIGAGLELGIGFEELAAACGTFSGVARRFELVGERDGVRVIDDYAHHPTELRAVLEAARQASPGRRLVAVFQPHVYSRTREFAVGFAEALMGAESAVILPIYPSRERAIPGVTSELVVAEAIRLGHPQVMPANSADEAIALLDGLLRPGDVMLTLGAGDVFRVAESWVGGDR
jgi:UDP-N-acetylmuramate--alanine ligase